METNYTFGELLKQFRSREGLSQIALAAELSMHRNTIGNWEKGDMRPDTREKVMEVAGVLSLSEIETDSLLYTVQYPLEFATPLEQITSNLSSASDNTLETEFSELSQATAVQSATQPKPACFRCHTFVSYRYTTRLFKPLRYNRL